MKILALTPYAPWPPYGGGTMRIYQLLRGIALTHGVTCLTFVANITDQAAVQSQLAPVTVIGVAGPAPRNLRQRAVQTLTNPLPDMALRNLDVNYRQQLDVLLQQRYFDVVVAFSIEMAPYLDVVKAYGIPTLFDEFNAEYIIQQRAAMTDAANPLRWHGALYSLIQWQKLKYFEKNMLATVNTVTAVSTGDAQTLSQLVPTVAPFVVPNGVDTSYFDRRRVVPHPFVRPTLVFSGTLDYRPNIDALRWFVAQVLPLVRQTIPDVVLVAVGRRPTPVLVALQAAGELSLTGEVPDTRAYLCGAHVYVVPMRIGGGVRLKVLEAMALAVPIVSTRLGVDGIDGLNETLCSVADTPQAMAAAIVATLATPPATKPARDFVVANYDWRVIVPRFLAALAHTAHGSEQL